MNKIFYTYKLILIFATLLLATSLRAQTFNRIKEINTTATTGSMTTFNSCAVGSTVFLVANDGNTGSELWKTDGSALGTVLVKDIRPGVNGSSITNLTEANGLCYFSADDGVNGAELWRSDGTQDGTYMLKNITIGITGTSINQFFFYNGLLYFSANNVSNGTELWKSDGTESGTNIVKDINPGSASGLVNGFSPNAFVALGAYIYFPATNPSTGRELWRSDGTEAGTTLVRDIFAGTGGSINFLKAATFNGKVFFQANNGGFNGAELWATDGTVAGTYLVKDIVPGIGHSYPNNLTAFNGSLYFTASITNTGTPDLWKTDGTSVGTTMVRNFAADGIGLTLGFNNSNNQFTVLGNKLYFVNQTGPLGIELYITDGTTAGTGIVKDLVTGINSSSPTTLTPLNGKIYFSGFERNASSEKKLFVSDGTTTGTSIVTVDELSIILSVSTGNFVTSGNQLYFGGITIDQGNEIWKTDGTSINTNLISDINKTIGGTPNSGTTLFGSVTMNGNYYFSAANATQGHEIWKSDGTEEGTVLIKDIWSGKGSSNPSQFFTAGGFVYFSATDNLYGTELWKTDGTEAGTVMLKDIWTGSSSSGPRQFTVSNNIVYFLAEDPINGRELWKTDGTEAGTSLVLDLIPGISSGLQNAADFISVGNYSYYAQTRLYKVDGTTNSLTELSSSIVFANDLGFNKDTLYIIGRNAANQTILWKSLNGSSPVMVKIISNSVTNGYQLTACNGKMYFNASNGTSGQEPWVSDGTEAGTYMIKDISPGTGNSQPFQFVAAGDKVYFQAASNLTGSDAELWGTDGTEAGTTLIKDILPGVIGGFPSGMISIPDNKLLFIATDGVSGVELWKSNGTAGGTSVLQDFNTNGDGFVITGRFLNYSQDFVLTRLNKGLIFFARSNDRGSQLHFGEIPQQFYVNDNSIVGDVFTSAIGNNSNTGTTAAPFATLQHALTIASANDVISVDAGSYSEQVIINKGITIRGAGQNLTLFTPPSSTLVPAPGPFTEIGLFETTQGIGDVHIRNLSINSNDGSQNIILQCGGSVSNCALLNGQQGIFFRIESAIKTALIENNTIQPNGIGINCQGSGLSAIIRNNNISKPTGYYAGIFAGLDFGPLPQLTIQNNNIQNYFGEGMLVASSNGNYILNSIIGTGTYAINRHMNRGNTPNATCNWFGSTDIAIVSSKISGIVDFSPFLTTGTDNSIAIGFQPVNAACSGRNIYYVNDNSITGDVFTLAVGNNSNNGSPASPFATISYALTQAAADDYIYVDAGTYTEQVTTNKGITIIGAGQNLTSILKPAVTVAPPGSFLDQAVIQTAQGIVGDVHLSNLSVTGDFAVNVTPIILQTGGSVKNCKLQNGSQGIFVRIDPLINLAAKTFAIDGNTISAEYIAVNFAGTRLTGILTNNTLAVSNTDVSFGVFAGLDFGALAGLTVSGNSFTSFANSGIWASALNGTISQNSFTGAGQLAINQVGGSTISATCNWYGSADASIVVPKISGNVNFSPWLSNGTDANVAVGFQPLPNVCNGRQNKLYVNDNSQAGDVFTTAVGNNSNSGIPTSPFATLAFAIGKALAGDTIFIDAGNYLAVDMIINKSVTILGSNYLLSPNNATNASLISSTRNAETMIDNSTWTIAANDINLEGLTFNSTSKQIISLNNVNFSNIKFTKNRVTINSSVILLNFNGVGTASTTASALINAGLTVTDNRFEKYNADGGVTVNVSKFKNVIVSNNAFVNAGTTMRTQIASSFGSSGVTDLVYFINNTVDNASSAFSGARFANTFVNGNKINSCRNAFVATNSILGSSDVYFTNNTITGTNGIVPFIQYDRTNGSGAGASSSITIENNSITGSAVAGVTTLMGAMNLIFQNSVLSPSLVVRGNIINYSGDFASIEGQFIRPMMVRGNLRNAIIEKNEISLSGINLQPRNPAIDLPVCPAITLYTDDGPSSFLQPGSVINILNNKISGFKHSFAAFDPQTGGTPYVGFGGIPAGVTVNVNNNSFTGDSISINNGDVGQMVSAICNWYGAANAAHVISKVTTSTVTFSPWLTNGTDTDVAIGFQPLPNICNGIPVVASIGASTNVTCNAVANGSINAMVAGGLAPFNYAWSKDNITGFSTLQNLSSLAPGNYQLVVTDINGSTDTVEATITEPDVLTLQISGTNNICFNGNAGTADVLPSGGTAPYSYLWSNGVTSSQIENLPAGTYTVTVTDANRCSTIGSYIVTQPALLTVVVAGVSTVCSNSATALASGGTGAYRYLWNTGATTNTVNNLAAGTYTVTVTDANLCTAVGNVVLTGNEAFNPSASTTDVSCFGGNNGTVTVNNVNGTAPFRYSINNGLNYQLSNTFTGLVAGTYTVAVVDANGCAGFVTKLITQPLALSVLTNNIQSTCFGASTGAITITATGGSGGFGYSWTGPAGFTATQANITNLAAGSYSLTVTDKNGCPAVLVAAVPTFNTVTVNATATNIACKGETNASIVLVTAGGTGTGFSYLWNTGVTTQSISNLPAGNYTVSITDIGSGCVVSRSFTITQPATNLSLSALKTNATGCATLGTITAAGAGGTPGYTYKINNGSFQTSGVFNNLYGGDYTVLVRDANGCTVTKLVNITDNGGDAFEGNNSKNQAKPIVIGSMVNARIALATDIADWFRFTTPAGSNGYTLSLTHPSANFTYNVFTGANNSPALVPASTTGTSKTYSLNGNTTYYISVTGGLSFVCYNLMITAPAQLITKNSSGPLKEIPKETSIPESLIAMAFPNPHKGNFNLKLSSPEDGMATIIISNAYGQQLLQKRVAVVKGNLNTILFSNQKTETLFYRITVGTYKASGTIVGGAK